MSSARTYCLPVITILFAAACGGDAREESAAVPADTVAVVERAAPFAIEAEFMTPESVLYDEAADRYLVSNINGEPLGRDGNGFISRIRPDGTVEQLRWIDGAAPGITLHAPKGLALRGDTLFVADIDSVRAFHRVQGTALGTRGIANATFLNDLAVGADGALYVTDTGMDESFASTGTDAVHQLGGSGASPVAAGTQLAGPNGIAVDGDAVLMVPFGAPTVWRLPKDGSAPTQLATLPGGQLDGLVLLPDRSLLVSSWETGTVYRVSPDGQVTVLVEGLEAPADIGWDSRRNRVLIPLFMANRVEVRDVR